jgi:hypothetical protein
MRPGSFRAGLTALGIIGGLTLAHAAPVTLITTEEAGEPPPKGAVAMSARGVTRGPKIELVSPLATTSPLHIALKFQSYGGATIDVDSVKVIYLRANNVELTDRVKPFISANGIDIPEAQLPPGNHVLRVDLKDSEGRTATTSLNLKVGP